jgi:hypothetical protein
MRTIRVHPGVNTPAVAPHFREDTGLFSEFLHAVALDAQAG